MAYRQKDSSDNFDLQDDAFQASDHVSDRVQQETLRRLRDSEESECEFSLMHSLILMSFPISYLNDKMQCSIIPDKRASKHSQICGCSNKDENLRTTILN
jgi:hypothetical protein